MATKTQRQQTLEKQIVRLERRLSRLKSKSDRFTRLRLVLCLTGTALGIAVYYLVHPTPGWALLAATLAAFNMVAFFHRKLHRSIRQHTIWLRIKRTQHARLTLNWQDIPLPDLRGPSKHHPFALDLDIAGETSLHQLLNMAISRDGSQRLLAWLTDTAPEREVIERRQRLVKELAPMTRFREKLLLDFALVSEEQFEGMKLLTYLQKRQLPRAFGRVLWTALALTGATLVLFGLSSLGLVPSVWIGSFGIYVTLYFFSQPYFDTLLHDAVFISEELNKLKVILKFLESNAYYNKPALRNLCRPFLDPHHRPSKLLTRISWVNWTVGLRMNPLMRIILNAPLPWDFLVAQRIDRLKREIADSLGEWLHTIFELEALVSLANFAYLNPQATYPEITDHGKSDLVLEVNDIGHPLIPEESKKRNNFAIGDAGAIVLITGSNMSGKSTFLKTIGINLSLAAAGGAVDARGFRTRLFRLFTCIQINDSVTDGFSFFYSEVKRLRALLDACRQDDPRPVFFLIDEIFKGTNNRERLIGSRSYIRELARLPGLGIITTHDLELTQLADTIAQLENHHFREEIKNGRMKFDYRIRSGPCPTTNALKIMQLEGLPVAEA